MVDIHGWDEDDAGGGANDSDGGGDDDPDGDADEGVVRFGRSQLLPVVVNGGYDEDADGGAKMQEIHDALVFR